MKQFLLEVRETQILFVVETGSRTQQNIPMVLLHHTTALLDVCLGADNNESE